ncbi:MAG: sulfur carrier protein ThiS [Oscillospiraceae bacterium]|nr:sulfur carrier protein ThiS [Oscillospiraceae bacterium]
MVKINGNEVQCEGMLLSEYLEGTQYNVRHIAVEINDEIVPKATYESTILQDGDNVEIVSFVGGG